MALKKGQMIRHIAGPHLQVVIVIFKEYGELHIGPPSACLDRMQDTPAKLFHKETILQKFLANMQGIHWDDHRFVLAMAREGTLAAAARQLKVNESTVARRIARLEEALDSLLFERLTGQLVPTDACHRLVRHIEQMEAAALAAETTIRGSNSAVSGTVRLTSVPTLCDHILVPALPRLLDRHPALTVELIADPRDLSLTKRQTDIALRLARPTGEQRALARRVGSLPYAVYHATNKAPDSLPWIIFDDAMAGLPQATWIAQASSKARQPLAQLRVHDSNTLLQAVRAGLGKSLLPTPVATRFDDIAQITDSEPVLERELWLMTHPDMRDLARIKAVLDWVAQVFHPFSPDYSSISTHSRA